jgi:hypothetical protein
MSRRQRPVRGPSFSPKVSKKDEKMMQVVEVEEVVEVVDDLFCCQ